MRVRTFVAVLLIAVVTTVLGALFLVDAGGAEPLPIESQAPLALGMGERTHGPARTEGPFRREMVSEDAVDETKGDGHLGDQTFNGSLSFVQDSQEALLLGDAMIQLCSAEDISLAVDEGGEEFDFSRYGVDFSDTNEPNLRPAALGGDWISVERGRWTMRVPQRDLVIARVRIGAVEYKLRGERRIHAGDRNGSFRLQAYGAGSLHVLTDSLEGHADRIVVMSTHTVPPGKAVQIVWSGNDGPLPPPRHSPESANPQEGPQPPPTAELLAAEVTTPISIENRDYPRTLWVGAKGYQWEKVYWPAGAGSRTVLLRPTGVLDIALVNCDFSSGPYELRLARDSSPLASWIDIRGDGVFTLAGCGAGLAQLFLRQVTRGGKLTLIEREITVEPGTRSRVVLDLGADLDVQVGALTATLKLPPSSMRLFDMIAMTICPLTEGGSWSRARMSQHLVRNLELVEPGTRQMVFRNLPVGEYRIGLTPSNSSVVAKVLSAKMTTAELDITGLSDVTIWPEADSGLRKNIGRAPGVLSWAWRPFDIPGAGTDQEQSFPSVSEFPARWDNGAWHLFCLPGELTAVVEGSGNPSLGGAQTWSISGGRDEVAIQLSAVYGLRIDFLLDELSGERARLAGEQLAAGVRSVLGNGVVDMIQSRDTYREGKRTGLEIRAYVSSPGAYRLDFLADPGNKLSASGESIVEVERGVPAKVRLKWIE